MGFSEARSIDLNPIIMKRFHMCYSLGFGWMRYALVPEKHGWGATSHSTVCFTWPRRKQTFLLRKGLGRMAWLLVKKPSFCFEHQAAPALWNHPCTFWSLGIPFLFWIASMSSCYNVILLYCIAIFLMELLPLWNCYHSQICMISVVHFLVILLVFITSFSLPYHACAPVSKI